MWPYLFVLAIGVVLGAVGYMPHVKRHKEEIATLKSLLAEADSDREDACAAAYDTGLKEGSDSCKELYNKGFGIGVQQGSRQGYTKGYKEGYQAGIRDGFQEGHQGMKGGV